MPLRRFRFAVRARHGDATPLRARLCVVGILPSHAALQAGRSVLAIEFVADDAARTRRERDQWLDAGDALCVLRCSDGTSQVVHTPIAGRLLETNALLLRDVHALNAQPERAGYVALLLGAAQHN